MDPNRGVIPRRAVAAVAATVFAAVILEVSGSKDYMDMWVAYHGREPEIEPLLRNLGLR